MKEYEYKLLQSGCCSALVSGSYYIEDGEPVLTYDFSGLTPLSMYISEDRSRVMNCFNQGLDAVIAVAEAAVLAADYLIPAEDLSIRFSDIYFDAAGKARLMLNEEADDECEGAAEAFRSLCREIDEAFPFTKAAGIADKIKSQNIRRILSTLSALKLEANNY